jgi:hypothetical protein
MRNKISPFRDKEEPAPFLFVELFSAVFGLETSNLEV